MEIVLISPATQYIIQDNTPDKEGQSFSLWFTKLAPPFKEMTENISLNNAVNSISDTAP